jgi:hypothetical protein
MKSTACCARYLAAFLLVAFTLPWLAAQQPQQNPPLPNIAPPPGMQGQEPENGSGIPPEIQKQMEKKANQQRHSDLKRDTEKLLRLSTELKEYVDKSNENILSLDVIKKADEIEKLARSVKTKMRGSD